jgi:hypothetical protein
MIHEITGYLSTVDQVTGEVILSVPGPKGEKGDTGAASTVPGPKGDKGDTGSSASVTSANITSALGFTPDSPTASRTPTAHTHPLSQLTQSGAASGQVPSWNGSSWVPSTPASSSFSGNTDAIPEGSTNLFFTAARAVAALASTLSSYATQAWVTAQGFATTSSVSSAISALVTGVSSVAGKTGAVTLSSADVSGLAPVATSGAYADLSGKPTIPAAQVNSDWNATSGVSQILNKPTIPAATTDASLLTSGTLADARLSSNVTLDNINNPFTAGQTITAQANTSALTASYSVTGANTTPLLDLSGTWNTTGVARGILLNVTDTASAATSRLLDLQVGGTSRFVVRKDGVISLNSGDHVSATGIGFSTGGLGNALQTSVNGAASFLVAASRVNLPAGSVFGWVSGTGLQSAADTILARDAANTLAQRNGTAGQAFRLYNQFVDSANFERGFMRWNSNVLEIGTEAGGTGTANRSMRLLIGTQPLGALISAQGTGVDISARSFSTGSAGPGAGAMTLVGTSITGLIAANYVTGSSDPTTTTITNGNYQVHRNTTSGQIRLWANNNGTMVSVALS